MDESAVDQDATPGLSCFVDVFERVDLFDKIDNQAVVSLSSLGQKAGSGWRRGGRVPCV